MLESLPNTIEQLHAHLSAGELTVKEALIWQQQRLQDQSLGNRAVVEYLDLNGEPNQTTNSSELQPLSGVGLAHKDIFNLSGRAPGLGLGLSQPAPTLQMAPALACLHQNGARHLASLHMAPLAFGATSSNADLGPCTNPLNPQAIVGGSSSGSAVAVAQGWVYGSLGTDTAGSVRIPAASCGLVGLKTSHALVSTQGCAPLAPALDTVGVLARSFGDARSVLLGALPQARTRQLLAQTQCVGLKSARIRAFLPSELDADVSSCLLAFIETMNTFQVEDAVDPFQALSQSAEILMLSQIAQTHAQVLELKPEPFNVPQRYPTNLPKALAESVLAGLAMPAFWAEQVTRARAQALEDFLKQAFEAADFVILPALATPLPLLEEVEPGWPLFDVKKLLGLHRYMGFVNYLGLPAVVAPVGVDRRGLPICAQVLARPDQDVALLDWAEQHWSHALSWSFHAAGAAPSSRLSRPLGEPLVNPTHSVSLHA